MVVPTKGVNVSYYETPCSTSQPGKPVVHPKGNITYCEPVHVTGRKMSTCGEQTWWVRRRWGEGLSMLGMHALHLFLSYTPHTSTYAFLQPCLVPPQLCGI